MPNLSTDVTADLLRGIEESHDHHDVSAVLRENTSFGWVRELAKSRRWRLQYEGDQTQWTSFLAYYSARGGSRQKHEWNHPDGAEPNIPIRFEEGTLRTTYEAPDVRAWEVTIVEVD